jgi:hypothetical protein
MIGVNQRIELKTLEHDIVALRLDVARQPRIANHRFVPRQLTEQSTLFFGHRDLHLDTPNQIHIARTTKKSQTLSRGFPLKVVGRRGDWLQVQDFENDKGWILRTLTSSTPYHIVKVKTANVRSQPTTSSRIVGKVSYGDALKTLERKSGWVKVQRDGGLRGWISRKLLWGW